MPPELEDYLPQGFSFQTEDYDLDYDNRSSRRRSQFQVGITFISEDTELGLAVLNMLGNSAWSNGRRKVTWIIDG